MLQAYVDCLKRGEKPGTCANLTRAFTKALAQRVHYLKRDLSAPAHPGTPDFELCFIFDGRRSESKARVDEQRAKSRAAAKDELLAALTKGSVSKRQSSKLARQAFSPTAQQIIAADKLFRLFGHNVLHSAGEADPLLVDREASYW